MPSPADSQAPEAAPPSWITPELIAEAREVCQLLYEEDLTDGDILDLLQNLGGVFEFLYGSDAYDPQVEE